MVTLKLPDGSSRAAAAGMRSRDVAEAIGKRLAQAAVAAKVNGEIVDLDRELPADGEATFEVLTDKSPEALAVLRHSCAHVMASAVLRLFPGTKLAFGPALDKGFYYDIDSPTPITEADFGRIEDEMRKIVAAAEPFERFERPSDEARALCADMDQPYKVEHIGELAGRPGGETLSFYRVGEFIDLCRGPHVPHSGKIGAFKLLSIAGAYWKGDVSRSQLQRLYGTAFFSQKELDAYSTLLEEAKKRDHRVLGKQLRLFTISQQAGSGLILWMPKGATIRGILETFIKEELLKRGYQPVYTPHIGRLELYRTSGHFPYYRESQYPPLFFNPLGQAVDTWLNLLTAGTLSREAEASFVSLLRAMTHDAAGDADAELSINAVDLAGLADAYEKAADAPARAGVLGDWLAAQEGYLVKPMNCPHHIQIYKAQPRSYRDLPVRLAEFGTVYRFEKSGQLNGLTRVRGFTQDDAHLFVTPEQVEGEMRASIELVMFVLQTLGLADYRVRVSLRDPASDKYVGSPENWDQAEKTLVEIVKSYGLPHSLEPGEAAFYGPKIDFVVRDCIGREWQLGTVQLDYNLPERFGLEYNGSDNKPHRPVMIHRAPFGSMERFFGILIEHFAGAFPLWLAPEQVRVVPVRDQFADYAKQVEQQLRGRGIRASADLRSDDMRAKIRDASLEKVPYMAVVGEKEMQANAVAVRDRHVTERGGDIGAMPVAEFVARLEAEIADKRIRSVSTASAGLADTGAKFAE